jgi:hypothetical protein
VEARRLKAAMETAQILQYHAEYKNMPVVDIYKDILANTTPFKVNDK